MSKYDEEAKKKRICPVISNTYKNGGWFERDAMPYVDPIGDVVEELNKSLSKDFNGSFCEDLKKRCIKPEGKFAGSRNPMDFNFKIEVSVSCCSNPQKYKNVVSNNLKFWACRNCGADLGDIE